MAEVNDKLESLTVVKRNGKKVNFDATRIALAIKKGFDSVEVDVDEDEKARKYTTKDVQKVYQAVLKRLTKEAKNTDKFNAENVRGFLKSFKKETKIAIKENNRLIEITKDNSKPSIKKAIQLTTSKGYGFMVGRLYIFYTHNHHKY